jgi:two-component sensor histidine kinase
LPGCSPKADKTGRIFKGDIVDFLQKFLVILMLTAISTAFYGGIYQYTRNRSAVSRWATLFLWGISFELASYLFLFLRVYPPLDKFFFIFQMACYLLLDVSFFVFTIYFSGHPSWVNLKLISALAVVPLIVIALQISQWNFPIGFIGFQFQQASSINWAFQLSVNLFIGYSFLAGISTLIIFLTAIQAVRAQNIKTVLAAIFGIGLIILGGVLEVREMNPFQPISILQLTIAADVVPIFLIIFTWKTADIIPSARRALLETMDDGYLILDASDKIIEFNPLAQQILGEQVSLKQGLPLGPQWSLAGLNPDLLDQPGQDRPATIVRPESTHEVKVFSIGEQGSVMTGKMVIFHNTTGRERLEEALRQKNVDLAKTNSFLTLLSDISLKLQSAVDPLQIITLMGAELRQHNLTCFVALYPPDSDELVVDYFSETKEITQLVENILGARISGFRIKREQFRHLYRLIDEKQIRFLNEKDGIEIFLGNIPGLIKDTILNSSAITRGGESTVVIPLLTAQKTIGLLGVWGKNITETDMRPFSIFGSQLAWTLERASLRHADQKRLQELSRSNALITALTKVSSILVTNQDWLFVLETLGAELKGIGLYCGIFYLDEATEDQVLLKYLSIQPDLAREVEKLVGRGLENYPLPMQKWPDFFERGLRTPLWFSNPEKEFRKLFPRISQGIDSRFINAVGMSQGSQLCFQPLLKDNQVNGVMAIWGPALTRADAPALSIFSHQVAGILANIGAYEKEVQHSIEQTRSKNIILGLSHIASKLDTTSNFKDLLETLGEEFAKVNLSCMVGMIDDTQQTMKVEYLSPEKIFRQSAGMLGFIWPKEIIIHRRLWPTDKAVTSKQPYWDPNPIGFAYKMFPFISKEIFEKAMQSAGLSVSEPVCYLPMIIDEKTIGILAVWGKELREVDIPGLSVFANQVSLSLKNTNLLHQAQAEIKERIEVERQIREMLSEKDILIKEIHHRVKNNLQVISSLLNLQAGQVKDAYTVDILRESQNRVHSMALIHEKLYQSSDLSSINFEAYLHSLVTSLSQTYRLQSSNITVHVQAEQIFLSLDTAIPCGLIVNELVSNSFKYAFPDQKPGTLNVACRPIDKNRLILSVEDDGIGLPEGIDIRKQTSLGLKLVNSLVRQIDGELTVRSAHGAHFTITFQLPN